MNKVTFTDAAWSDYVYWQTEDRKTLRRINALIDDIKRNRYEGTGKPEPLIGDLTGYWSRRIDTKNRLVYRILNDVIEIYGLRNHYDDK
jgi:toxin YoeB